MAEQIACSLRRQPPGMAPVAGELAYDPHKLLRIDATALMRPASRCRRR